MINHEHKFIYIHPPKTGGTSIEKLFIDDADITDVPDKHRYAHEYATGYDDFRKFATVRNPYDRAVSYYFWRQTKNMPIFGRETFSEWIEFITDPSEYEQYQETFWHFVTAIDSQSNFVGDTQIFVRFENFQNDFDRVCQAFGLERKVLPHTNPSKRGDYREYYDEKTKQLVEEKYADDIVRFNYSF